MKLRHFETLKPLCPVCLFNRQQSHSLRLREALKQSEGDVIEGTLGCPNPECQSEFPIIDAIPIIVSNVRNFVSSSIHQITARTDLSEHIESLLTDCCGPGSTFEVTRQHLSTYCWDHYADLDPNEPSATLAPGSLVRILHHCLDQLHNPVPGHAIDIGCSVGRTALEMAHRSEGLVLGVDLNFAMLQVASRVLRSQMVNYHRRRVGTVYDRREFPVVFPSMENVDFWACDATQLPFSQGSFQLANSLNLLDCVHSPLDHLTELARMLSSGGRAIIATPYDWAAGATAMESWLGGHSQRSETAGASEPVLRSLLTPDAHPCSIPGLRLVHEISDLPWHVRMHDRSIMRYEVHVSMAEKQ